MTKAIKYEPAIAPLDFSRGSTGTYFDNLGVLQTAGIDEARLTHDPDTLEPLGLLIEEQRTNLLLWSEDFTNAAWGKIASGTGVVPVVTSDYGEAPDGTMTADRIQFNKGAGNNISGGDFSLVSQILSGQASATYTNGVWLRSLDGSSKNLIIYSNGGSTGEEVLVTPSWKRYTITTETSTTAPTLHFGIRSGDGSAFFEQANAPDTADVLVWGAQLEEGSFPTSYTPSTDTFTSRATTATFFDSDGVLQTAAIDVARDDAFGYLDGVLYPIGLLLEEQRTNFATGNDDLATYLNYVSSPNFGNTTRTTVADSGLTPNFTIAGLDLTADSDGNVSASTINTIVDVTQNYALSAYFLPGNADAITLDTTRTGSGTFPAVVTLDLNTGVVTGSGAGLGTFGAREVNDGWWYLYVTRPAGTGSGATHITVRGSGLLSGESVRVAAINAEVGLYPTSHIPTFGSQVTRAADVSSSAQTTRAADNCSRTLGSEFNASEGTFFIDIVPTGDPNKNTALVGSNDNNLNPIFYAQTTDNFIVDFRAIDAGALYSMQPAVQASAFSRSKIAVSYGTSGTKMAVNGVIGIDESLPINISAMSSCKILIRDDGAVFNAECKQLKYFPRALSATELQELTA